MTLDTDHSETESNNILTLTLCWRRILMASTWSPWLALCRGARPFLVLTEMGAPRCSIASTTFSWPDLAAQGRSQPIPGLGIPTSHTMLPLPILAATCREVMLF